MTRVSRYLLMWLILPVLGPAVAASGQPSARKSAPEGAVFGEVVEFRAKMAPR